MLAALTASLLIGAGCGSEVKVTDDDLVIINATDLDAIILANTKTTKRKKQTCLIDSRIAQRFAAGHIAGAVNLISRDVRAEDPRFSEYKTLVIYGQDWMDSSPMIVSKRLLALRYEDVRTYRGGVVDWQATGHVLIPSPTPSDETGQAGP
ncbi:MAG: rhodanese-like domain-containing protein [Planctomycetes bacterium]|nr:rhodanese-like domain-containing protein [Planctomycetota bacterium]